MIKAWIITLGRADHYVGRGRPKLKLTVNIDILTLKLNQMLSQ
jgi:hypothetical protein